MTDATGSVIVSAAVTATHTATGVAYRAASNDTGTYVFPSLPPGAYRVSCQLSGFKRFEQSGLMLETGFARTLDIKLDIADVNETVQVRSSTPLLEAESATVGQLIERTSVLNMPLQSRLSGSLVRLMGAVTFREEVAGFGLPSFSMAGGRSRNQMWLLDGGFNQNNAIGVPQTNFNPPSEGLQEFKAEMNSYSAEHGRNGGGLILMTTRSGTNQLHGSVYEFVRNDKLDARTFFAPGKAPLRYNIFGGAVGGPIQRNRTFFFFNYEGTRRRDGVTVADADVPHPGELGGDFSGRRDVRIMDPATRQPFPENRIPASRIDPIGRALAVFYPGPNTPNNDITRAPGDNYVVNVSDRQDRDYYSGRLDHAFGVNDRTYYRVTWVPGPVKGAAVFPTEFADSRAFFRDNIRKSAVGSWIHSFTPTFVNEARYGFQGASVEESTPGAFSGTNAGLGLKGVDPEFFPRVDVTGLTSLGSNSQLRVGQGNQTHQFVDNVTWIHGKHQLKTGFEFRYSDFGDELDALRGGQFTFNDRATGNGLASLLLGWVSAAAITDSDVLNPRTDYYAAFLQDDWKVTSRFTLNIGLRWEMDTPRWTTNGRQSGFALAEVNPVSRTPGVITYSGRDGRVKYAHDFDTNNFGPRVGFAWRIRDTTVVRGGYGIAYNGAYEGGVPGILNAGFSINGSFPSPDGGFTPPFLLRDGMPAVVREELGPGFGAVPVGTNPRFSPEFLQQNHVNGYMQQWNLNVQQQFAGQTLFEIAYLANVGHKLGGPPINLNMTPLVIGRGPDRQDQRSRPYPQFNNVSLLRVPWGNSSYHAMNVKLEKRYSHGLNFLMNYTWAKFLDDAEGSSELAGGEGNGYTHLELRRLDKSYSGNDIRHRYVAGAVYELPVGRGRSLSIDNPVLNRLTGGWGVGLIVELRTGPPYGAIEQTNRTNTFSASQRPNLLRDPQIGGDRSRGEMLARYFDASAFEQPAVGVFGNAARNQGFGPGVISTDLSLTKKWVFREDFDLQFRAEFFNLPNRPNFGSPAAVRGRGDFGQVRSTLVDTAGRQIQFGLRLAF